MIDRVQTLDLQFQDRPETIAAYLYPHDDGVALIETGPGSTFPRLQAHLAGRGLTPADITEVLLTHIHLDHAGAAGHFAQHGATIYAHHIGVPHLVNPKRLWASATRIYGDDMKRLWGDMHPVPESQLVALDDGDAVPLGSAEVLALDTPGHASHHLSYVLGSVCFTGDVGGVRLPGPAYVELPLAPPEIDIEQWRTSLSHLQAAVEHHDVTHLAPTHFGVYADATDHLDRLSAALDDAEAWANTHLPALLEDDDALEKAVIEWMHDRAASSGVDTETWERYELANPSWMAALGLKRYWQTHRA